MTAAIADSKSPLAPPLRKQPVMEDRKRPLNDAATDEVPPSKRQAMTNDEPQTQEDVVNFQKEAIYRQMKSYKREKELSEIRLEELQKRCTYHDDHLRIVDAWWNQMDGMLTRIPGKLVDEVRLLVDSNLLSRQPQQNGDTHDSVPQSLLFADVETFEQHLAKKKETIKETLLRLFQRLESRDEDASEKIPKLQKRISELLATEKTHRVEMDRISHEKEETERQLAMAGFRYLQAEKRLDRLRSQTVAKIEQQAIAASSSSNGTNPKKDNNSSSKSKFTDGQLADAELARKEAEAIASKQEKEIKQLQADMSRLQEQNSNYSLKITRLSEEDIVNCDTYKNTRLRLEDVIAKLNHLEAHNTTLSRENETLQAERTAFQNKVKEEESIAIEAANTQAQKYEADLARVRAHRDQLHAELHTTRIASEKSPPNHADEMKILVESQLEKIASLEGEVQRLRIEAGQSPLPPNEDIANLSHQELIEGMTKLQSSHSILENEFKAIETAWKKAHDLSKAKFDDLRTLQETIVKLKQDKIRNEQKVFEAVKLKEGAVDKARLFQAQHDKASEIIMNLKNSDKKQTTLIANLEKQLAELRLINNQAILIQKTGQTTVSELKNTVENLQRQVNLVRDQLKAAEEKYRNESTRRLNAENELEKMNVRVNSLEQSVKVFNSDQDEESTLEGYRSMVRCGVCRTGQKSCVIKTCGHLFCKDCIGERISSRNRKCPNCGRQFAATDVLTIVL
ncbi:E3 ubiquitin-protein ligase [Drechslerella dactyloides]|uniref:E3 ubiquitin protein ligase n=1 Tax=Drechslerella dactyloides TaxID=74499 RepID=A0AAD6J6A4_DREDA|nr:E3 ubiquitin-protein ligase [Drechslerella dactyloides]